MKTNQAGIDLIKRFEGCKLAAYKCPAGIWTIGYGHTGPDVKSGLTITQAQADTLLRGDLAKFEDGVWARVGQFQTAPNQFSAMVSLAYNIGLGGFDRSSVLARHKEGNHAAAADAFLLWNKAAGKVLDGLTRRRNAERSLYLSLA